MLPDFQERRAFEITYSDLDSVIKRWVPDWDSVGTIEALDASNNTVHEFNIDGNLHSNDEHELKLAMKDPIQHAGYGFVGHFLEWLCKEGHIVAGDYYVEVCW
jgi:hypothetical protein